MRWHQTGDVQAGVLRKVSAGRGCGINGCPEPHYAKDLCAKHYKRQRRHGDPMLGARPEGGRRCSVEDCPNDAEERGWCHGHYQRWRRVGDVQAGVPLSRRRQDPTCAIEGCGRDAHAHGLCGTHYKRAQKNGDPLPAAPIRVVTGEGSLSHGYTSLRSSGT